MSFLLRKNGTPSLTIWPVLIVRALQADSTVTLYLTIDPCDTNGINENGMANLTLYPNPTTGMVNVQFTMNNVQLGLVRFRCWMCMGGCCKM